jgi:hypothetical protein
MSDRMPRLALLISIWLRFVVGHYIPYAPAIEERQTRVQVFKYYEAFPNMFIDAYCDEAQKSKLQRAWEESKLLANAQTEIVSGYNYDLVHKTWLGEDWNRTGKPLLSPLVNYRTRSIRKNFEQLKQLYNGRIGENQYIYWWCHDPGAGCQSDKRGRTTIASSWVSKDSSVRESYHTVWCGKFFEAETLGDQITRAEHIIGEQVVLDTFDSNSAVAMFRETFHFEILVGSPAIKDFAYHAGETYQLAKKSGTKKAYINADSYAMDALAIYVQQKFQLSSPPLPRWVIEGAKPPDLES